MTTPSEGSRLPIDSDVDAVEDARHHRDAPGSGADRGWPRFHADVLLVVFAGGCVGGLVRYLVLRHWPGDADGVPWSTLAVNLAGAFVLALVVVSVARRPLHRWTRPLLGTGFCGALTTFSSVAVSADELFAHRHPGAGTAYLLLTMIGCVVAALAGFLVARTLLPIREASG